MSGPARTVQFVGDARYRDGAEALLCSPGDAALVMRGRPRSIIMACPDRCGDTLVINLDPRTAKAWRLDMRGEGVTLYPSVWREGRCGSHFVVWRGRILWDERFADGNEEPPYDLLLEKSVLAAIGPSRRSAASEIADGLDELVWDVDRVLRRLSDRGLVDLIKIDGRELFSLSQIENASDIKRCAPAASSGLDLDRARVQS